MARTDAATKVIRRALADAIAQVKKMGRSQPPVSASIPIRDKFWAIIEPKKNAFQITINNGTESSIQTAWSQSGIASEICELDRRVDGVDCTANEALTRQSLTWLMLHELMHVQLGHFDYLETAAIVRLANTKLDQTALNALAQKLDVKDPSLLRQCFEMQADWEATDCFLAGHDAKDFTDLRIKLSAALLVICVIEHTNLKAGTHGIDHPSAAARFFAMMAGLFQRFLYSGATLTQDGETSKIEPSEPTDENTINNYKDQLVKPVIGDAISIASSLGLTQFLDDIFDHEKNEAALFQDIFDAQFAQNIRPEIFRTGGARQWCQLLLLNERLVHETGLRV